MDIKSIFELQKVRALRLRNEPVAMRKDRIKAIKHWIQKNDSRLIAAATADLAKPAVEFQAIELLHVFAEIRSALRHLDNWSKPRLIDSPVHMLGTRSSIYCEAKGTTLILSPWNYPFALAVGPLISALAAGNTVFMKPSELSPSTSSLIREMADSVFEPQDVCVREGDASIAAELLRLPFDHIFFTGSQRVGKIVMKAAAENLSSVTLELGGKAPAIVSSKAKIAEAAKRILVSKFVNAGQTCVAPDYVLVERTVADRFVDKCRELMKELFKPSESARIVSDDHFMRLQTLLDEAVAQGARVEFSGNPDREALNFPPVLLTNVPAQSAIMTEEIFGPVLPVISYDTIDEAITIVNARPKPLALYLFTTSTKERVLIQKQTSAGGMCVNDAAIHFLHPDLPFGGVKNSGIGKAHGYAGFLAFSNEKPVMMQRHGTTLASLLYPPYGKRKEQFIRAIFRLLYR